MKNVKTFNQFLNEQMTRIPMGEVRGGEIRIEGVGNKLYLTNFDKNIETPEKKKFLQHIKDKYGSVITQISTHLGDLVIDMSIYVNKPMADTFQRILNDIFTQRTETNQEAVDREEKESDE